jgi:NAD(P)H-hydrate epimerase
MKSDVLVEKTNKRFWKERFNSDWIGPGEVKSLLKPSPKSHKGQNGQLLIFAGSKYYHAPLVLSAKVASKFVDLVFIYSDEENTNLLKKMKTDLADFIPVTDETVDKYTKRSDCILMGPGVGRFEAAKNKMTEIIKKNSSKKFLLDADALNLLDPKILDERFVVTPQPGEFKRFFGLDENNKSASEMAKKYGCTIVLKGKVDYVYSHTKCKENHAGNVGMTKGATGDVLAGVIASLMTKNDNFPAASAGVFLNGLAGDRLKKKVSYWYNASDLVEEIPKARKWCEDF